MLTSCASVLHNMYSMTKIPVVLSALSIAAYNMHGYVLM